MIKWRMERLVAHVASTEEMMGEPDGRLGIDGGIILKCI
jgi:hypothetical protein